MKHVQTIVGACLTAALSAACGGTSSSLAPSPAIRAVNAAAPNAAATIKHSLCPCYNVIYTFGTNANDGTHPNAELTLSHGTFYSTTETGGGAGQGTVFSITPEGAESVLHSFAGSPDGNSPEVAPIVVNGVLYGTTAGGGLPSPSELGTVYSLTMGGTETVLHRFAGGRDGSLAYASLLDAHGTLYSTTYEGGSACGHGAGCGTVFTITTSGTEHVLYRFKASAGEYAIHGAFPRAGLVDVNGVLYGTTFTGGTSNGGTVFRITPGGSEAVLHSFGGSSGDGAAPEASLLYVDGMLYGTTEAGGRYGAGTIFSVTTRGTEKVLHNFAYDLTDGAYPVGSLVELNGVLYGTTRAGGAYQLGTLFSLTKNVKETLLHSFGSGTDGAAPYAGLTVLHGTLYGTTEQGGDQQGTGGRGAVYSYAP